MLKKPTSNSKKKINIGQTAPKQESTFDYIEAHKEIMDELTAKISENPYVVALEYEDHSDTGSTLEHEILPGWEHTVRRFSHH